MTWIKFDDMLIHVFTPITRIHNRVHIEENVIVGAQITNSPHCIGGISTATKFFVGFGIETIDTHICGNGVWDGDGGCGCGISYKTNQ